jgi:hypothetical protein
MTRRLWRRILSIDWDYFVDCREMLYVEDYIHYCGVEWLKREKVWKDKYNKTVREKVPFTGPTPQTFLKHFDLSGVKFLDIRRSHAEIMEVLGGIIAEGRLGLGDLEVVNVDAHHDILYSREDLADFKIKRYTCGNWGGTLVHFGLAKSLTQVYPSWRSKVREMVFKVKLGRGIDSFIRAKRWAGLHHVHVIESRLHAVKGFKPDVIFICWSGPWVPPVYDDKFVELCKAVMKRGGFGNPENHTLRFPRF